MANINVKKNNKYLTKDITMSISYSFIFHNEKTVLNHHYCEHHYCEQSAVTSDPVVCSDWEDDIYNTLSPIM